jgi:hypothetical protein
MTICTVHVAGVVGGGQGGGLGEHGLARDEVGALEGDLEIPLGRHRETGQHHVDRARLERRQQLAEGHRHELGLDAEHLRQRARQVDLHADQLTGLVRHVEGRLTARHPHPQYTGLEDPRGRGLGAASVETEAGAAGQGESRESGQNDRKTLHGRNLHVGR